MRYGFMSFLTALAVLYSGSSAVAQSSPLAPNFTGYYAGATFGYSQGRVPGITSGNFGFFNYIGVGKPQGPTLGLHAGYSMRYGPLVGGLEVDGDWSSADDKGIAAYRYNGTLRARLGYAFDNVMIYGAAGAALHRRDVYMRQLGAIGPVIPQSLRGWTYGGGVEYAFARNWTARIEYRYSRYGNSQWTGVNPVCAIVACAGSVWRFRDSEQALRFGVTRYFAPGPGETAAGPAADWRGWYAGLQIAYAKGKV